MRTLAALAVVGLAAGTAARASETSTYTYDAQGRLVVIDYAGSVNNGEKHTICYDTADNRIEYKSDSGGAGVTCPSPTAVTVTMPLPSIAIGDAAATEGSDLAFEVTLSNPYTSSLGVNYATATGTAGSADFTATSGTVTFAAGEIAKTIIVHTTNDTADEADAEAMYVNLSSATGGATIADSQGVGQIYDDDEPRECCGNQ